MFSCVLCCAATLVGAVLLALLAARAATHCYRRLFVRRSVQGKVVLVTGGSGGLGRELCLRFARSGAHIVAWDINEAALAALKPEIEALGVRCHTATVNIASRDAVRDAAADVQRVFGQHVEVLVNNAGIVTGKRFLDVSEDGAARTIDINTTAHFWTVRAFLPAMKRANSGVVVSISSAAGLNGVCGLADYCASKHGAFGFNDALRLELRRERSAVRTLTVCPFYINTGMFANVARTRVPWLLDMLDLHYVADEIHVATLCGQEILVMPFIVTVATCLKWVMPTWLSDAATEWIGVSDTMSTFAGRSIENNNNNNSSSSSDSNNNKSKSK